jgi:enoyl-[acyl-carrier protein] reductase II
VIQEADSQIVLAAGGIADGQGLVDVLLEGAEGAWVGTRMAASVEAYAHKKWKKRVVAASAGDTVITPMFGPEFSGAHARVLRNRVVDQWAEHEDEIPFPPPPPPVIGVTMLNGLPYPMPKFSVALPTRDTLGDFEEMALFAGGVSAGLINDIKPAAEIVADMAADACAIIGDQLQT